MVTKKNTPPPRKKSKLKKRKSEKYVRKHSKDKFTYKYRSQIRTGITLALVLIVIVSGVLLYRSSVEAKSTVERGDEIRFNFICYYDTGQVIQHTIVPNPDSVTVDTPLDDDRLKNPQRLTVGGYKNVQGVLLPLYWNDSMLIDLKKGQTTEISIPAEWVYGENQSILHGEERTFSVSRETETERFGTISLSAFENEYGEPEVGKEYEAETMTISVTEFDDSTVSYEVVCEPGDELFLEYGRAVVTEKTEDTIYARYEGDTDTTFFVRKFNTWVPVHITDVTEDELQVEIDHYNYKIRVESVEKDAIEPDEWTAEAGDFVKMRYIGYYEDGEVFDSSFANVDEVTPDMTLDNSYAHNAASLTVKPGTTLQGTNTMITGVNEALKGMGVGDEKTITVPPEDGYGEWDEDKVREIPFVVGEYPIIETLEKDVTMTVEEFLNAYQGDPYEGNQVELPYGQGTIVSVSEGTVSIEVTSLKGADEAFTYENLQTKVIDESDDTFTIERLTEDGKAIPVQGATAIAHVEGDTIVVAFDPDDYAVGDRFGNGSITEITDDAFVVDANHPMAGKTLMFKLRVVAVKKVA